MQGPRKVFSYHFSNKTYYHYILKVLRALIKFSSASKEIDQKQSSQRGIFESNKQYH